MPVVLILLVTVPLSSMKSTDLEDELMTTLKERHLPLVSSSCLLLPKDNTLVSVVS